MFPSEGQTDDVLELFFKPLTPCLHICSGYLLKEARMPADMQLMVSSVHGSYAHAGVRKADQVWVTSSLKQSKHTHRQSTYSTSLLLFHTHIYCLLPLVVLCQPDLAWPTLLFVYLVCAPSEAGLKVWGSVASCTGTRPPLLVRLSVSIKHTPHLRDTSLIFLFAFVACGDRRAQRLAL